MRRVLVGVAAAAMVALPARAQQALEPLTEPDTVVKELVVTPARPGPAWWRVVDDDSIVYIMIAPPVLPTDLGWDRSTLDFRMKGANRLITPVDLSLLNPKSLLGATGLLLQAPKLLTMEKRPKPPRGISPLEERLPAAALEKFVAARTRINQPAARYAALTPMEAVQQLERDYRNHFHLAGAEGLDFSPVQDEMRRLARANRVPVEAAYKATIPAVRVKIETIEETKPPKVYECVVKAIDQMTARVDGDLKAAKAWAAGDVRPLLRPLRFAKDPECHAHGGTASANSPKIGRMEEDYVRAQVAAIERAMNRPGHSLAILYPLSPLGRAEFGMLGTQGVLARLRAKGYEIRTPAGAD